MRRIFVIVAVLAAGLAGFWWLGDRGDDTAGQTDTANSGAAAKAPGQSPHLTLAGKPVAIPSWFGQPGAPAGRIAGRVVQDGQPVAGAKVRLSSVLFSSGFAAEPVVTTGEDGRFDFGELPAARYLVTATAAERTPFGQPVDLRDPDAQPPADQLELRLRACRAYLVSAVADASGGPIAAAAIRVRSSNLVITAGITDDQGKLAMCVPPGQGSATVRADGYGTVQHNLYTVGRTPWTVEMTPAATLSGRVVRDGEPVAGARITVSSAAFRSPATNQERGLSDENGNFTISTLAAGRYTVTARAGDGQSEPSQAVLRAGEVAPAVTLELLPTVSLRGVTLDGETPVAGVRIRGWMTTGSGRADAVSQADGTFTLRGLRAGQVEFASSTHELIEPKKVAIDAEARASESEPIQLAVAPRAEIRGRVIRNGKPVADALVTAQRARSMSDANGGFVLRGLREGDYTLYAESLRVGAFTRGVPVSVAKGQTVAGIELVLDLEASIAGRVIDEQGNPVPGAFLTFRLAKGNDYGRATASEDGSFVATAMSGGGEYRVTIQSSSATALLLRPANGDDFPTVALADGTTRVTGIEFVVSGQSYRIAGRVERESGAPVADALVEAFMTQRGRGAGGRAPQVLTDMDGRFELAELPRGTYSLFAHLGEGTRSRRLEVEAGREDVVITVPDTGSVEGEISGFNGPVEIVLSSQRSRQRYRVEAAREGFRLDEVAAGDYLVMATSASEGESAPITVEPGQVARVSLTSQGSGRIEGRLVDFDSREPVTGYSCQWVKRDASGGRIAARSSAWVKSDSDGRLSLSAPSGTIELFCPGGRRHRTESISVPVVAVKPGETSSVTLYVVRGTSGRYEGDPGFVLGHGAPTVRAVAPQSLASKNGLKAGDVLIAIAGVDVSMLGGEATRHVLSRHTGQTVEITVRRGAEQLAIAVEVEPRRRG